MAGKRSRDRYAEDLVRMEELARECEQQADRCHRYADEAVIPSTAAMFRTLAYAYDAQAQALEVAIEQANYMDREGMMSEFLNTHARALQGDRQRERDDEPREPESRRPGDIDEATPAPPSDASEEEGSTADEARREEERAKPPRERRKRT